jgi:hypothetical protein
VTLKYFAYGSNMSLQRLLQRTPSARPLGRYALPAHELRFHKIGRDGSGKCDAFHTGSAHNTVLGVLYQLAREEKPLLDRVEGLGNGYREDTVTVYCHDGQPEQCFCYFATHTDNSLAPYTWYKRHVLVGAREAALPPAYIGKIARVQALRDPDGERDKTQLAIHQKNLRN